MTESTSQPRLVHCFQGLSACSQNDQKQQVHLFTAAGHLEETQVKAGTLKGQIEIKQPLIFREALRTLLAVGDMGNKYQATEKETFEAYGVWRKALNAELKPIELKQSFAKFLADHDPNAWFGLPPSVSVVKNAQGQNEVIFEQLDPSGRVYGALRFKADSLVPSADLNLGTNAFSGFTALYDSLSQINQALPVVLQFNPSPEVVPSEYVGEINEYANAPESWLRAYGQLLTASTLKHRTVSLSRMDIYNMLRHLRLNTDVDGESKSIRFELVPGKPVSLTLEPWQFYITSEASVYRGSRAELIGIWDRRDLFSLQALLPYIESVTLNLLGEAQPAFWTIDCGACVFTLGIMGFRPSNWSRSILLDIEIPRNFQPSSLDTALQSAIASQPLSLQALSDRLAVDAASLQTVIRKHIQLGKVHVVFDQDGQKYVSRTLWDCLDWSKEGSNNQRMAKAYELVAQKAVSYTSNVLGTGETEIQSTVKETLSFNQQVATYKPQFQLNRDGATRKLGCDCAWMKDRESQKIGPCAHIQALFLQYALDEQQRRIEIENNPELIEFATKRFVRKKSQKEWSIEVSLKKNKLEEKSTIQAIAAQKDQKKDVRSHFLVFLDIASARNAYFNRIADLERLGYMDASQ